MRLKLHQKKCELCRETNAAKESHKQKFDKKRANQSIADFGANMNHRRNDNECKLVAINLTTGETSDLKCPKGENPMSFEFMEELE